MFGYMTIAPKDMTKEQLARFRQGYCGLCRSLGKRYGQLERLTLSNDMTFLSLLLSSLYEPAEERGALRCPLHPVKKREFVRNVCTDYAADMNVILAYFKCLDDLSDEKGPGAGIRLKRMEEAFRRAEGQYPEKCRVIRECLQETTRLEKEDSTDVDALCNLSGRMLGEIFSFREDSFSPLLRSMGEGLGRFIYFMDAYEDYPGDIKKGRFNPLRALHEQTDYEAFCLESLRMLIAEAVEAVEMLPLEKDLDILRNVMYTGVWVHYARIHQKEKKKEHPDE